jgi:hypothetical protein
MQDLKLRCKKSKDRTEEEKGENLVKGEQGRWGGGCKCANCVRSATRKVEGEECKNWEKKVKAWHEGKARRNK